MSGADRLYDVQLDDRGLPAPSPEEEQERRVAVFDLAEANEFALTGDAPSGPYALGLSIEVVIGKVSPRCAGLFSDLRKLSRGGETLAPG